MLDVFHGEQGVLFVHRGLQGETKTAGKSVVQSTVLFVTIQI